MGWHVGDLKLIHPASRQFDISGRIDFVSSTDSTLGSMSSSVTAWFIIYSTVSSFLGSNYCIP
ncbi:hypothetical protein DL98DRAFT_441 [Cadophora sp. DSE1049]|nr:hypothetical protein DL98DRAFT_441 [Cadophora sp. DSE1049]